MAWACDNFLQSQGISDKAQTNQSQSIIDHFQNLLGVAQFSTQAMHIGASTCGFDGFPAYSADQKCNSITI